MTTYVNPPDNKVFGSGNVIMTGRSRRHYVPPFEGTLSLKGIVRGAGEWTTTDGRFVVQPDSFLLLNDRQIYSLTIDSRCETETFCVFFARGLVERAVQVEESGDDALLDAELGKSFGFVERVTSSFGLVGAEWRALIRQYHGDGGPAALEWRVEALVSALVREAVRGKAALDSLSAAKPSTRTEIVRRLGIAREAMQDDLACDWVLADMGRHAAMAPHHFHRCHRQVFGETPMAFLSRRRLERAYVLLATGEHTVTGACLAVGYLSLGSFSRAFAAQFGVAPSKIVALRRLR